MESRCHLGEVIRYDTVGILGWGVSLQTHPIKVVLEQVLGTEWKGDDDSGAVPKAKKAVEVEGEDGICVVCPLLIGAAIPGLMVYHRRIVTTGSSETSRTRRRSDGSGSRSLYSVRLSCILVYGSG